MPPVFPRQKLGVSKEAGRGSMQMNARLQQHLLGAESLCGFSREWTDVWEKGPCRR